MIEEKEAEDVETVSCSCRSCGTGAGVLSYKATFVIWQDGWRLRVVGNLEGMFIASLALVLVDGGVAVETPFR